jgi:Glycosyltransferase family 87
LQILKEGRPALRDQGGNASVGKVRVRWEVVLLAVALLAGLFSLIDASAHDRTHTLDFATFYTGGQIVRQGLSRQLYHLPTQAAIQHRFDDTLLPYMHPPFEALLFVPFTIFSYPHALLIWDALNLLVWGLVVSRLEATGYRLGRPEKAVWWCISAVFLFAILILGQDSLLLVPVFLFAFLDLKRGRELAAGLWLGAGLFRFELVLPFVFIFLLRRRWKVLGGFFTVSVLALGVSVAMLGWRGLIDYARLLVQAGQAVGSQADSVHVATMPSLRGLLVAIFGRIVPENLLFPLVMAASLGLLIWAAWQFRDASHPRSAAFDLEFSMAAVAALLVSYHVFVHELTPLVVIAYLLLGYEAARPRKGVLGNRGATALLSLFVAIFGVGWLVFHVKALFVEALVLLALMAWLSAELAVQREAPARQS